MALGNPAAAMAAQGLLNTIKKVLSDKRVVFVLIAIVVFFLLKKYIKKGIKKIKENKFDKQSHEDPNKLALNFRSAANPSGYNWMIDMDGTDEETMLDIGQRIKDLNLQEDVSKAYRLKYDETLEERASKELDGEDLRLFESLID